MPAPATADAGPPQAADAPPPTGYLGLAALLRLNFSGVDLTPLGQALLQRAAADPGDAEALMDAAAIFLFRGQAEIAVQLQREAIRVRHCYRLPASREPALRVLALMVPGDLQANVPIECLVEDSDVELSLYYTTGDEADLSEIPDHDVLFVAISETEANRPILDAWLPLLDAWPRPVLNDAHRIERVARDTAARLLADAPGVAMPPTLRLDRADLLAVAAGAAPPAGLDFPLLVRPVDSHAGHDLHKTDTREELAARLAETGNGRFFVAPFVDYRSPDGQFRKVRVVLIGGRPYVAHLAISDHWMIHYLNAGMADDDAKRAEEARFMADFDVGFAARHADALAAIHARIGLDYLGIDCAETRDGRLLVFEVDHAMVVHAMDPLDRFAYKQPVMHKLFAAFRELLQQAAR